MPLSDSLAHILPPSIDLCWLGFRGHSSPGSIQPLPFPLRTTLSEFGGWIEQLYVRQNLTFTGEDSPMSNLLLSLLGAVAEFERSLIRERQREGIELAKKKGVYKGRKPSLTKVQVAEIRKRVRTGEQKTALAAEYKVSRQTLYSALG